ncbi:transcriptional regulator [Halobacteriales archaeon QH_7_65_31]|nr:MAG: transcriptional regulator [Halobacteriales archaeon QH_7_65_31]
MRRSGSWQSVWDDRILEWIRENDGTGTAKQIDDSGLVRVQKPHITRRLKKLTEHGLVKHVGNGAYLLTKEGEGYLDEEYDVERSVWLDTNQAEDEEKESGVNV